MWIFWDRQPHSLHDYTFYWCTIPLISFPNVICHKQPLSFPHVFQKCQPLVWKSYPCSSQKIRQCIWSHELLPNHFNMSSHTSHELSNLKTLHLHECHSFSLHSYEPRCISLFLWNNINLWHTWHMGKENGQSTKV